jgi:hypothetical protein
MEALSLEKFKKNAINHAGLQRITAGADPVGECTGGGFHNYYISDGANSILCAQTSWESDVRWNDGSIKMNGIKEQYFNECGK